MTPPDHARSSLRFGRFVLEPARRALSEDGTRLALSARAFDVLLLLVERRGELVSKGEILDIVWRGVAVEENNLAVQISGLRRVLGEAPQGGPFIATVPGQGYRFVAEVEVVGATETPSPVPLPVSAPVVASPIPPVRRARWPTLAVALLGGVLLIGVAWWRFWPRPLGAPRLSLAVLPFRPLGLDATAGYLADAITDDLTTDLAHLPGATVIARESASVFAARHATAQATGRALDVRYLLDGSLSVSGNPVHIDAQLVDAASGVAVWSSSFDVPRTGLDQARDAIVRPLAQALDATLVRIEAARSLHERPRNPDAVDDFLRARSRLDRDDSFAGLGAAQGLLEQAVAAAPDFADAQAELALVLLKKVGDYDDPDEWADYGRARQAVAAALAAAPRDPLAIAAGGKLDWEDFACDEAVPRFALALSLDPDVLEAREGLAQCDHDLGRMPQMIADLQDLLRIDPLAPDAARYQNMIGLGFLMQGKLPESLDWLHRARAGIADLTAAPTSLGWQEWNWLYLIAATWQAGDKEAARGLLAQYRMLCPNRTVWRLSAYDTKALAALPGRAAFFSSLHEAGLPRFADERRDEGISVASSAFPDEDFSATPMMVPGARTIVTRDLAAMIAGPSAPRVLDVSHGAAMVPGAILVYPGGAEGDPKSLLIRSAGVSGPPLPPGTHPTIVVMGEGVFGSAGYDAAFSLVAAGFRNVLWYRGGEEAWVAAGNVSRDERLQ